MVNSLGSGRNSNSFIPSFKNAFTTVASNPPPLLLSKPTSILKLIPRFKVEIFFLPMRRDIKVGMEDGSKLPITSNLHILNVLLLPIFPQDLISYKSNVVVKSFLNKRKKKSKPTSNSKVDVISPRFKVQTLGRNMKSGYKTTYYL